MDLLKHSSEEIARVTKLLFELDSTICVRELKDSSLAFYKENELISDEVVMSKLESLKDSGFQFFLNGFITCYSNRVVELIHLVDARAHFIINCDDDLRRLESILEVRSLEEASNVYHRLTGKEVIDHRCDHDNEYTNVDAQDDPEFWEEEPINDSIMYKTV